METGRAPIWYDDDSRAAATPEAARLAGAEPDKSQFRIACSAIFWPESARMILDDGLLLIESRRGRRYWERAALVFRASLALAGVSLRRMRAGGSVGASVIRDDVEARKRPTPKAERLRKYYRGE